MPKISKKLKKQQKLQNQLQDNVNDSKSDKPKSSLPSESKTTVESRPPNELRITLNNKTTVFINYAHKILQDKEYNSLKLIGEDLSIPRVLMLSNKLKKEFKLSEDIKVQNLSTDGKLSPRIVIELTKQD